MSQEGGIGGRRKKLTICSDWLLLVEGQDEVNLFCALMRHSFDNELKIQVIDAGGKDQFPSRLKAIQTEAQIRPTLQSIGIVRDADNDPKGAFESVCNDLRNVGYKPPESHRSFSNALPSVGVFIVPDGVECGSLETLCRRSVEGSDTAQCVKQYLECLDKHHAMESKNKDKSFAHAFLAAMLDPVARVGEGALKGVWNFDSPAFQDLLCFVRALSLQAKL